MRTDFDPTAFRHGLAREGLSHLAHAALYGFGYLPSRHQPQRTRDIRTVVFVHGLGATRGCFFPLQAYLKVRGHGRQYSFNYRGPSIEAMAIDLKTRLKRDVRGGRIDIVAHSMGGLVARYYLQMLGGDRRVDRLITLATPHAGTHPSVYIPSGLGWQLKPGGRFITHLNAQPAPDVLMSSFAAGQDHLVLPASSALADFGETKTFETLGHQGMLLAPRVFHAVYDRLELKPESG